MSNGNAEEDVFHCPTCNKRCKNFSYFKRHLRYDINEECKRAYYSMKSPPEKKQAGASESSLSGYPPVASLPMLESTPSPGNFPQVDSPKGLSEADGDDPMDMNDSGDDPMDMNYYRNPTNFTRLSKAIPIYCEEWDQSNEEIGHIDGIPAEILDYFSSRFLCLAKEHKTNIMEINADQFWQYHDQYWDDSNTEYSIGYDDVEGLPLDHPDAEDLGEDEDEEEEDGAEDNSPIDQLGEMEVRYDPDPEPLRKFRQFCDESHSKIAKIPRGHKAGIELMDLLIKARAPLKVYDQVTKWHSSNGSGQRRIPRDKLMEFLNNRYNGNGRVPKLSRRVTLPSSKARVRLAVSDVMENMVSMLTDPRIMDDDYLLNDNPLQPPTPQNQLTHIGDINTGSAYIDTWKKLVKDPAVDLPWPNIFYIDSAVTGQNNSMPIEALKITNGFLKREARDRPYASRKIGYIPDFLGEKTKGHDIVAEHGGEMAKDYIAEVLSDEDNTEGDSDGPDNWRLSGRAVKAQDFHTMLAVLLRQYAEIQKRGGFWWDLRYKGKTRRVRIIPYILFVKGDTVEHDKLCGSYTSYGQGVKNLCRYCTVPLEETSNPYANYKRKTPEMIKNIRHRLRNNQTYRVAELKAISQQDIDNSWYELMFALEDVVHGIHGACPLEMLHWIQLGKFKQGRDMFFDQLGPDSALAADINNIAASLGYLYKRQSDRDLPRTMFTKGIMKGGLQAHEYSGVVLVLLTALRTKLGQKALFEHCGQRKNGYKPAKYELFGREGRVQDWILLLETWLEWEAWMKQDQIEMVELKRADRKIREVLQLEKKIGKREKGMGFNTFKFHAATHAIPDIFRNGVPSNVNTSSDEMDHKNSKTASLRTQRRKDTFDIQAATQIHNQELIALAMEEMSSNMGVADYFLRLRDPEEEAVAEPENHETSLGDASFEIFYNRQKGKYEYKVNSKGKHKDKLVLEDDLLGFLEQEVCIPMREQTNRIHVFTELCRDGHTFRASSLKLKKAWRDWAMFDFGRGYGEFPCCLHAFVDLSKTRLGHFTTKPPLAPGIYAVVETTDKLLDDWDMSELLKPYRKIVDSQGKKMFSLLDVESLSAPACVIPNLGTRPNADGGDHFLALYPREKWASLFGQWLMQKHEKLYTETPIKEKKNSSKTHETHNEDEEGSNNEEVEESSEEEEKKPAARKPTRKRKR